MEQEAARSLDARHQVRDYGDVVTPSGPRSLGSRMPRRLEFSPTETVESARRRDRYMDCPACGSRSERYLFHRMGVRFVRCRACDLVYEDPIDSTGDSHCHETALDRDEPPDPQHASSRIAALLETVCGYYERQRGRRPERVLVVGQRPSDLEAVRLSDVKIVFVTEIDGGKTEPASKTDTLVSSVAEFDVVLLEEFLEEVHQPLTILERVCVRLKPDAVVAVALANTRSTSFHLRRNFHAAIAHYNAHNLEVLMGRAGFRRLGRERLMKPWSGRVNGLASSKDEVIFFSSAAASPPERLSVIVPVYNEERYVREVVEALLAKTLRIDREIVIVESNSTDGSRDIVRSFESEPNIRIVYQEEARGKGSAVRAGLAVASGTIMLIQDADFEYDLDDYDALLEPILQWRTSFVLGSRTLGLNDWKVRQYAKSRIRGMLINLAQLVFAKTFNILYRQNVTDINTMFKVFRRECVDGRHLDANGFDLDIELVCKIVRNGFVPIEVPVNYVARGFDEGKKIRFLDAYPSYLELFRCRVARRT
jgi:hypothetical protein